VNGFGQELRDPRTRRSIGRGVLYFGIGVWFLGVGGVVVGFALGWFEGWGALGMAALGVGFAVGLGVMVYGLGSIATTQFTDEGVSQTRPWPFQRVAVRWGDVTELERTNRDGNDTLWLRSSEAGVEVVLWTYEDPEGLVDLVKSRVPSGARTY
jgi:hypothetical protein